MSDSNSPKAYTEFADLLAQINKTSTLDEALEYINTSLDRVLPGSRISVFWDADDTTLRDSDVAIPMQLYGKHMGIIRAARHDPAAFSDDEQLVLAPFLQIAALLAAEKDRLEDILGRASSMVVFDLKNPINIVFTGSLMLMEEFSSEIAVNADVEKLVKIINESAASGIRIIQQLGGFGWQGLLNDPILHTVDVELCVEIALGMLAESEASEVNVQIKDPLHAAHAKEWLLTEVFILLIKYILQTHEDGETPPNIEISSQPLETGLIRYDVVDSEHSIPADTLDNVFEKGTKEFVWYGGDLTHVKATIQRLGGEVGAHSKPGEGTTFWFTLPAPKQP